MWSRNIKCTNIFSLSKRLYSLNNNNNRNVLNVLKETKDRLNKCNNSLVSNSSDLESKILLSHVLQIDDTGGGIQLFNKNVQFRIITNQEYDQLESLISKRLCSEPISYLVGYKYFWKHKIYCNHSTLIPRPDSETIIEKIIEYYDNKNHNDIKIKPSRILDLGTGTGCLILSVLDEYKDSVGIGIDRSVDALEIANKNATHLNLTNRVKFINIDWNNQRQIKLINDFGPFDLIISNPPYISNDEFKHLNETVSKWEPKTALVAEDNGLCDYKVIGSFIHNFTNILSDDGIIVFEIGKDQHNEITSYMESLSFKLIDTKKDLNSIIRCLVFTKNINK